MKSLVVLFFFLTFTLRAQEPNTSIIPRQYSLCSSFQNEDIFVSLGSYYNFKKSFSFEFRYGVGVRRTFFQQALFSKVDAVLCYNFLKSDDLWSFGPSVQFSTLSLAPKLFKPIQRYYAAEIGYSLAFGKKIKGLQSSYIGFRTTEFSSASNLYSYIGYVFQLGLRYAL